MNISVHPQPLLVDIESEELIERNKKAGGTYKVQIAYAHTVGRDGSPQRYPEQINVFPPMDNSGRHIPFKKGQYHIAPQTFRVNNGFLELGFINLMPAKV